MISEGEILPDNLKVSLVYPDNTSEEVTIRSLCKNKFLVVFFYPKDMTPGCTIEVQKFRESYEEIRLLGSELIGCSKDSEKSHCTFINKHELPYPLIFDPDGKILDAFGVWGEKKMLGKSFLGVQRSTFVIKDNKIIKVFPKVSVKKHAEEVINFLKHIT